jgi:hypothetical protein
MHSTTTVRIKQLLSGLLLLILFSTLAVATDAPATGIVTLTDAERQWLKSHPVITLAPDPDFKPIEYFDKNGNYQGAATEFDYQWGIGIRKDWPELQGILNKGLAAMIRKVLDEVADSVRVHKSGQGDAVFSSEEPIKG